MNKRVCFCLTALLLAAWLSGCSSTSRGPSFAEARASGRLAPPNGKSMVMVYRTPGVIGAMIKPYVYINGVLLGPMSRGGFYTYETAPGHCVVAYSLKLGESNAKTKTGAAIGGALLYGGIGAVAGIYGDIDAHEKKGNSFTLQPGRTHYFLMEPSGGSYNEPPAEEAEKDIADCHWLNPS
jgi:hypothetical protein